MAASDTSASPTISSSALIAIMDRGHPHPHPQQPLPQSGHLQSSAPSPLLDALHPVLSLFHSLLTDADAARLLRSSRTAALTLLPSYTFTSHIFKSVSLASLRRLRDLCLLYQLRITQLVLPHYLRDLTFDLTTPHLSPIPASVTAVTWGEPYEGRDAAWAALSAAASHWQSAEPWRLPDHPALETTTEAGKGRQLTRWRSRPAGRLQPSAPLRRGRG